MKGREKKGPPSADLLVCFPSRAHLTLMPKPICSPARPSEPNKRHRKRHHNQYLKKSSFRSGIGTANSPLLWAKTKQISSGEISAEPTSPKVTCAGQIKVRHKASGACKNWQSVVEEIERIHKKSKHRKKFGWIESFGFKKDVMQFLTCLRNIRFDFRCFGVFPQSDVISDDEEEEEDEEEYQHNNNNKQYVGDGGDHDGESSRAVFSKWFMVLQEGQNSSTSCREEIKEKESGDRLEAPPVPPPNALLLMRCRSAPAKSWLEEEQEVEEEEEEEEEDDDDDEVEENSKGKEKKGKNLKTLIEEEKTNNKKDQNLVVMRYDPDFYKISTDIAKETWVVGGIRDPFSRSRSWKR